MKTVIMKQVSKYRWQIESKSGAILQENIMLHTKRSAEWYVRNYISTYIGWTYELKPLEKK